MTTPGPQPLGLPPTSPTGYTPVSSFSSYGTALFGQSATYRDDGKVLYAYTEADSPDANSVYSWRVVIATADTPLAFVTQDDSVTEATWVQRYDAGATLLNGRPPIPTLTRRADDTTIYLMLSWDVRTGGVAVTPEWNLSSGSPPDAGCVLFESSDDGETWSYVSTVRSGWSLETVDFPTCSEILFIDASTWWVVVVGRDGGFGDPQDVLTYLSTDSGATWTYQAKLGTAFTNQVSYVNRSVADWDDKLYFSAITTGSAPGAALHRMLHVASDGTGAMTEYETTANNVTNLWDERDGKAFFNVDDALRYYVIVNNDGVEVHESSASAPAYTDFTELYAATGVSGVSGQNFQAPVLQPIGGGWAAWLGLDFVLGVPWTTCRLCLFEFTYRWPQLYEAFLSSDPEAVGEAVMRLEERDRELEQQFAECCSEFGFTYRWPQLHEDFLSGDSGRVASAVMRLEERDRELEAKVAECCSAWEFTFRWPQLHEALLSGDAPRVQQAVMRLEERDRELELKTREGV